MLRKQFLRHSAVTARSPTSPLASQRSFLFPTLGKQIIGSSRMTRSQSTSTHFYLLWKPFNRIHGAKSHWMCFIPHFALLVIDISFKKTSFRVLVLIFYKKRSCILEFGFLISFAQFSVCCYSIQPILMERESHSTISLIK